MSAFTAFPGFTRRPGQLISPHRHPHTNLRTSPQRRTSRVTFRRASPAPQRRTSSSRRSKKRSPRAKLIKRISKGFKRYSPHKFKNPYIRDIGDLTLALSPLIVAGMVYYLYNRDSLPENA